MKIYTRYFALLLLIFSSALCHAALQNGKFEVAITKGQSSLINPQSIKEPVVKGKVFEQGYKVETNKDSTVELCLSNGSTILVNPETLLEIRTFRQVASNLIIEGAYQKLDKEPSPSVVEIYVIKGKIIGEVRKLNPQSSFTIKSPAGVARIRGTVYSVDYSRNESARTGNMEVACVKGSVEVTINGSDSGSQPVAPGQKMNAQTPLVDSPEDANSALSKKRVVAEPVLGKNVIKMDDVAGLKPGMKVTLDESGLTSATKTIATTFPEDVTIVAVDYVNNTVTLSVPVSVNVETRLVPVFEDPFKRTVVSEPILGKNVIKMEDVTGLKPGMKVTADETGLTSAMKTTATIFPDDVTIVAVDAVNNTVTLSVPVSLNVETRLVPVFEAPLPPPITNPTITFSKLGQDEVKTIADDLSKGTSLPTTLKDEVKTIADKTPPTVPTTPKDETAPKDGTTTDKPTTEKTDSPTETTNPSTNTGGTNTGNVNSVIDAINKTIQETIEKDNQKNPSPTQ